MGLKDRTLDLGRNGREWVSVWEHKNIEEEQRHETPRAPVLPQGAKLQTGVEDKAGDH